jgi:threonyl-tRNA synthetase
MIHCAIMGSFDRFFSVFIEHTAGWFPFWLAPEQVRILTINETVGEYVSQITEVLDGVLLNEPLKYNELRYNLDERNESLGRKIRDAVGMKVPVILIIGPKDAEAQEVSVRLKDKEQKVPLTQLKDFLGKL